MPSAKILIVEDEAIEALDLQQRLSSLGYTVLDAASTGEEAVGIAEESCPDLVLMDIMLAGEIDGVTAAEQIQNRLDIPIIYLTAYADEATLERAKITEPYGYIVKPFRERELHITIDMALYKHKMERRLKESERWLATTLRSIGDAVVATDRNGLITFMNPVAEDLMGWKLEEVLERKLTEVFKIVNRNTRMPVENPVERVILQGLTVGLANHTVLVSRNGKEVPIDDSAAPIKDDKGNIIGVILVFRDVTERKRAEEELRKKEAELAMILNRTPFMLTRCSRDLYYRYVSRAYAAMIGRTPEEIAGKSIIEIMGEKGFQTIQPHVETVLQGQTVEYDAEVPLSGVEPRHLRVIYVPDRDEPEQVIGWIASIIDITDRKRMEEELRKSHDELELRVKERTAELERNNRTLQEFAFVAAHDLSEPLRKIQTFGSLLEERSTDRLDEREREYISRMKGAAARMRELLDALLNYSRVDSKPQEFNLTSLDNVVKDAIGDLEIPIRNAGARVEIGPLPLVHGDPYQLRQLFQNLIANAVKYHRSEVRTIIKIYGEKTDGAARVFVEDNGIGFDEKYLEKIFQPFQRLHGRNEYSGTGIGLAICRKIVERHGGTITGRSTPNKGSTFVVRLPVKFHAA